MVTTNPKEMGDALNNFWGNLFSSIREYDPEMLEKMIANHSHRIPDVDHHEVNRDEVLKLIMRTTKSVPGPDGIPFIAYKTFVEPMLDMWVAAIQEAGEDVEWEGSFGNALLVLLKKVDGCPRADQFRPISITNAQYRVIVRYWALWFARQIGVLSETQAAMAQGRVIDSARMIALLEFSGDEHLLDIGCGFGDPATTIAQTLSDGGRVTAIDPVPEMIDTPSSSAISNMSPTMP